MAVATAVMPATTTTSIPVGGAGRSARRKQRCWIFRVDGITSDVSEVDLLASVRERYTTVKRLVVRSASSPPSGLAVGEHQHPAVDRNVLVEVQFTGPQPSEGPGALLCDLLSGSSVEAKPVELPRGRKKRARTDAASSEASDSDVEDGGSRKMSGHRSTNSLQQVGEEEEEESPGGGRCITAKPIFNGQGGSPMNRVKDDPGAVRRTSGRDSGGPVAPSSGLAPLSSIGLFKASISSAPQKPPSVSCVVVPADTRSMPDLMPPHQLRVVSLDTAQQQQQQPPQQHQHLLAEHQQHQPNQGQQQQQQQQGKVSPAGVAQWDDVVGRMTTPQNSSHSLDMGPVDLSNSSAPHQAVKTEFDPLLGGSANSGGTWGSNDSQTALFGPMPPPQPVQPPLRGWSFDSSHTEDNTGSGDFTGGNMVMDLSDVDNLFRSTEPEGKAASGEGGSHGSAGSSADAGAGSRQEQGGVGGVSGGGGVRAAAQSHKWTSEDMLPMEKVAIEPSRKECDFEGRPVPTSNAANAASPPPTSVAASPEGQCHLAFTGLDKTGHDLRSLRVTAHFGVDSVHKVGKVTGPIKIGANGRAFAALFYPSMQEIWPELYSTGNIRVVEVDVVVEIRSDIGEYQYVGPQLKVTYLRTPPAGEVGETEPLLQGRRIASRAPIPFSSDSPQISYSCVDYSCGDWFSDICHSVFRSGATAHQPLPDDPSDLMNVDS